jgi:hypothetical protein
VFGEIVDDLGDEVAFVAVDLVFEHEQHRSVLAVGGDKRGCDVAEPIAGATRPSRRPSRRLESARNTGERASQGATARDCIEGFIHGVGVFPNK